MKNNVCHSLVERWVSIGGWLVICWLALWFFPMPAIAQVSSGKDGKKSSAHVSASKKKEDAALLAKALDYYLSKKYHECLIILERLNKEYRLNPRYKAYLGVCYYQEWEYEQAVKCLDEAIPQLVNFAPLERSFYDWIDAESYFAMQQYEKAILGYEQMLSLCQESERSDAYYRLGFCHLFQAKEMQSTEDKERVDAEYRIAKDCLEKALAGYLKYRNTNQKARIAQIRNMLNGLR